MSVSVERLQIKTAGLVQGRHVAPQQARVPLTATRTSGEAVGGVRLQGLAATQWPASHNSYPPLTFDIVDGWNDRALGGCVYHVAHPGGRHYRSFRSTVLKRKHAVLRASRTMATFRALVLPAEGALGRLPADLDLRRPASLRTLDPRPPVRPKTRLRRRPAQHTAIPRCSAINWVGSPKLNDVKQRVA